MPWIELEGAVNARDVGGAPLADGSGAVAPGRLLRSDNLQDLTAADVAHLVEERGVRAVVDLRTGVEVRLEGPGPLVGDDRVVIEHRSLYAEAGENTDVVEAVSVVPWRLGKGAAPLPGEDPTVRTYIGYLLRRPDSVVAALALIADPPGGGATLVHCAAGKDRTGIVVALALEVAGVGRDAVIADYAATGDRITPLLARLAATPTYAPDIRTDEPIHHTPQPEQLRRVLDLLDERHGGVAGWLAENGFDAEAQSALRARLRR